MADCCATEPDATQHTRLLWTVLILNAAMFAVEFTAGWRAQSAGLLADSLDMLADALVYSLSLYAIGRSASHKARAALANGSLQLALGIGVLGHLVWRIFTDATPDTALMGGIAVLALGVNVICFALLYRFRAGEINLRASWICSRNDMLANAGVLLAAWLVHLTATPWPDWIIAGLIAGIVIRSALHIIIEARAGLKAGTPVSSGCCG